MALFTLFLPLNVYLADYVLLLKANEEPHDNQSFRL